MYCIYIRSIQYLITGCCHIACLLFATGLNFTQSNPTRPGAWHQWKDSNWITKNWYIQRILQGWVLERAIPEAAWTVLRNYGFSVFATRRLGSACFKGPGSGVETRNAQALGSSCSLSTSSRGRLTKEVCSKGVRPYCGPTAWIRVESLLYFVHCTCGCVTCNNIFSGGISHIMHSSSVVRSTPRDVGTLEPGTELYDWLVRWCQVGVLYISPYALHQVPYTAVLVFSIVWYTIHSVPGTSYIVYISW